MMHEKNCLKIPLNTDPPAEVYSPSPGVFISNSATDYSGRATFSAGPGTALSVGDSLPALKRQANKPNYDN